MSLSTEADWHFVPAKSVRVSISQCVCVQFFARSGDLVVGYFSTSMTLTRLLNAHLYRDILVCATVIASISNSNSCSRAA